MDHVWAEIKRKHLFRFEDDVYAALEGCLDTCGTCTKGNYHDYFTMYVMCVCFMFVDNCVVNNNLFVIVIEKVEHVLGNKVEHCNNLMHWMRPTLCTGCGIIPCELTNTLGGDEVSMLTHTYPHKFLREIKVTICNHQPTLCVPGCLIW